MEVEGLIERRLPKWFPRDTVIIGVVCALAFFLGLGSRTLFSKDVVRYAEIAREMIHFDSWWVPYFNGDVYANKPAPYLWLIAWPSLLSGQVNEWTARLPSAIAAVGTVIFTYLLGRRIAGREAGLFSVLSLAACYQFVLLGRVSRTDMPFAFFVVAGVYFLYGGVKEPSRRGRYYVLACAMGGLSVAMKGPAGIIIILLTAIGYAVVKREWSSLRSWSWLWGVLLLVALVAAWLVPTCIVGGNEFSKDLIFRQNIDRFAGEIDRAEPFYFYFYKLPLEVAPLNLLLPLIIVFYMTVRRERKGRDIAFPVVYLAAAFVLFEASSAKNIRYLLPMFPGIAVLFGLFWDDLISTWPGTTKAVKWTMVITLVVVGTAAFLSALYMFGWTWIKQKHVLPVYGVGLGAAVIVLLITGAAILRKDLPRMLLAWFCGASMIVIVFSLVEIDRIEGIPRQVAFSRMLREKTNGGDLYLYKYYRLDKGETRPAEFFYYGKYTPPISDRAELEELMMKDSGVFYLLMLKSVYEEEFPFTVGHWRMWWPSHPPSKVEYDGEYVGEKVVLVKINGDEENAADVRDED